MILEFMGQGMKEPTIIYEDNQPCIDIIRAGHITKLVKHIAIPVGMIGEEINRGHNIPVKIPGILNPPDNGTKPNPSSTFHRLVKFCRGQRFYPPPGSEHFKLLQLHLLNHKVNEVDNENPQRLLNLDQYKELDKVFENKHEEKKWVEELVSKLVLLLYSQVSTYISMWATNQWRFKEMNNQLFFWATNY